MKNLRTLALAVLALGAVSLAASFRQDRSATEGSPPFAEGVIEPLKSPDGQTWWKGNLHTHSLWSDGDDFPEMIADWYKRHGYNFLTLSDHNVLSEGDRWVAARGGTFPEALRKYRARFGDDWVQLREKAGKQEVRLKPLTEFRSVLDEPGKFLLIQGEEITHRYGKNPVHLNGINLRDVIPPVDGASVPETIIVNRRAVVEQSRRQGRPMLTFLNHPNFGWGVNSDDLILDEDDRACGVDEPGELCIRSTTLTRGYWNRPDLNQRVFLQREGFGPFPEVWFRTGDVVVRRADGLLRFLGRRDRMVKTRGHRVELDEVEAALSAHPSVAEAAVFAVPDEIGSKSIHAAVTLREPGAADAAALFRHARAKLPPYAVPRALEIVRDLPRTSSGKIDRKALETGAGGVR